MNVDFLIAPLRMMIASLGTGTLPGGGSVAALANSRSTLGQASGLARSAAAEASANWQGNGGTSAVGSALLSANGDQSMATGGTQLAGIIGIAADRVSHARTELNALVDSFVRAVNAAAPTLTPASLAALVPIAVDHVRRGLAIITRTQSELSGDAGQVDEAAATGDGGTAKQASLAEASTAPGRVPVTLPDGSVAYAPNARAAAAVRAALSQRGVPYVWGGTTPAGFDCSGFTQWAYKQAGLDIPRLAQDQDTAGFQVSQSQLQPGDLAVWSGHVAMYIGNGQLVEAGDPVGVSPLRTTNLDQTFEGYYRPR